MKIIQTEVKIKFRNLEKISLKYIVNLISLALTTNCCQYTPYIYIYIYIHTVFFDVESKFKNIFIRGPGSPVVMHTFSIFRYELIDDN